MKFVDIKTVGLCSDHAGFELKQYVKKWLDERKISYVDYGTNTEASCDYPDYAHALGRAVNNSETEWGIAICGSGNGVAMTLNKYSKIRAALAWSEELSILARLHNNANVLVMPGRFISQEEADAIMCAFFSSDFEGGRHERRMSKIPIKTN